MNLLLNQMKINTEAMENFPIIDLTRLSSLKKKDLGEGMYCRVSLVDWHGTPLVEKVSKHPASESQTFEREVEYLHALDGAGGAPQLVSVFSSPPTIVCTFKGYSTLYDFLERGGIPDKMYPMVAIRIAERLQEVHAVGIVHNDLKTDNVMLEVSKKHKNGFEVSIIDYGLACFYGRSLGRTGKADHVAPEVRTGGVSVYESDVYSLGVLLQDLTDEICDPTVFHVLNCIGVWRFESNLADDSQQFESLKIKKTLREFSGYCTSARCTNR
ncbi:probable serine/threonine-protein kinase DDB_G0281745 [Panulirus ornatus]|uniref:probable serine/threonine-protein kinase DDB_G0281745 n=1 Tax=Panulirus ornatus TaxID=150431 RepID=UPI003A8BBC3F